MRGRAAGAAGRGRTGTEARGGRAPQDSGPPAESAPGLRRPSSRLAGPVSAETAAGGSVEAQGRAAQGLAWRPGEGSRWGRPGGRLGWKPGWGRVSTRGASRVEVGGRGSGPGGVPSGGPRGRGLSGGRPAWKLGEEGGVRGGSAAGGGRVWRGALGEGPEGSCMEALECPPGERPAWRPSRATGGSSDWLKPHPFWPLRQLYLKGRDEVLMFLVH